MNKAQFIQFCEDMLPDILENSGIVPSLMIVRGDEMAVVEMPDYPTRRQYYLKVLPQMLTQFQAEAYIFASEIWLHGKDGKTEGILFHFQGRDGATYTRQYSAIRNDSGDITRLVFFDKKASPMIGPLVELFHG